MLTRYYRDDITFQQVTDEEVDDLLGIGGSGGASGGEFAGLSPAELDNAFQRGDITESEYRTELEARGSAERAIALKVEQNRPPGGGPLGQMGEAIRGATERATGQAGQVVGQAQRQVRIDPQITPSQIASGVESGQYSPEDAYMALIMNHGYGHEGAVQYLIGQGVVGADSISPQVIAEMAEQEQTQEPSGTSQAIPSTANVTQITQGVRDGRWTYQEAIDAIASKPEIGSRAEAEALLDRIPAKQRTGEPGAQAAGAPSTGRGAGTGTGQGTGRQPSTTGAFTEPPVSSTATTLSAAVLLDAWEQGNISTQRLYERLISDHGYSPQDAQLIIQNNADRGPKSPEWQAMERSLTRKGLGSHLDPITIVAGAAGGLWSPDDAYEALVAFGGMSEQEATSYLRGLGWEGGPAGPLPSRTESPTRGEEMAPASGQAQGVVPPSTGEYGGNVERWRDEVEEYFRPEDVDKALHVIRYESGGRPRVVGDDGASVGLFQHNFAGGLGSSSGLQPQALMDPETNIKLAAEAVYGGGGEPNWSDWGENALYQGQPFGSLGRHPYPDGSGVQVQPTQASAVQTQQPQQAITPTSQTSGVQLEAFTPTNRPRRPRPDQVPGGGISLQAMAQDPRLMGAA